MMQSENILLNVFRLRLNYQGGRERKKTEEEKTIIKSCT